VSILFEKYKVKNYWLIYEYYKEGIHYTVLYHILGLNTAMEKFTTSCAYNISLCLVPWDYSSHWISIILRLFLIDECFLAIYFSWICAFKMLTLKSMPEKFYSIMIILFFVFIVVFFSLNVSFYASVRVDCYLFKISYLSNNFRHFWKFHFLWSDFTKHSDYFLSFFIFLESIFVILIMIFLNVFLLFLSFLLF
jgi:hypothetical protein